MICEPWTNFVNVFGWPLLLTDITLPNISKYALYNALYESCINYCVNRRVDTVVIGTIRFLVFTGKVGPYCCETHMFHVVIVKWSNVSYRFTEKHLLLVNTLCYYFQIPRTVYSSQSNERKNYSPVFSFADKCLKKDERGEKT